MRKIFALLSVLALMTLGCMGCACAISKSEMNTYENSEFDYSIMYPKTWDKTEGSFLIVQAPPREGVRSNMNVVVSKLQTEITIEEYAASDEEAMEDMFDNFALENKHSSKTDGVDSIPRVVTYTAYDNDLRSKQVMVIKDDHIYIITCTSREDMYAEDDATYYNDMVDSFEFTEDSDGSISNMVIIILLIAIFLAIVILIARGGRKKETEEPDGQKTQSVEVVKRY